MRKFLATLLLFVATSSPVFCQVVIKKENRVLNREPGYCMWASLSTLGRHYGIKALYNLVDEREKEFNKSPYVWINQERFDVNRGSHVTVADRLKKLNVKYHYQEYYNYDRNLMKNCLKAKEPCLIVVKWWLGKQTDPPDTHAIILLDYNENGIEFFDPNDVERTYVAGHRWFNEYWTGYTLTVEK